MGACHRTARQEPSAGSVTKDLPVQRHSDPRIHRESLAVNGTSPTANDARKLATLISNRVTQVACPEVDILLWEKLWCTEDDLEFTSSNLGLALEMGCALALLKAKRVLIVNPSRVNELHKILPFCDRVLRGLAPAAHVPQTQTLPTAANSGIPGSLSFRVPCFHETTPPLAWPVDADVVILLAMDGLPFSMAPLLQRSNNKSGTDRLRVISQCYGVLAPREFIQTSARFDCSLDYM